MLEKLIQVGRVDYQDNFTDVEQVKRSRMLETRCGEESVWWTVTVWSWYHTVTRHKDMLVWWSSYDECLLLLSQVWLESVGWCGGSGSSLAWSSSSSSSAASPASASPAAVSTTAAPASSPASPTFSAAAPHAEDTQLQEQDNQWWCLVNENKLIDFILRLRGFFGCCLCLSVSALTFDKESWII